LLEAVLRSGLKGLFRRRCARGRRIDDGLFLQDFGPFGLQIL